MFTNAYRKTVSRNDDLKHDIKLLKFGLQVNFVVLHRGILPDIWQKKRFDFVSVALKRQSPDNSKNLLKSSDQAKIVRKTLIPTVL
jgi:hypothetical protein